MRRIFHMYVHEGMGSPSIAVRLTDEGIPTQTGKLLWLQSRVHHILGNATYTRSWVYGKYRHISTEDGMKVYDQPRDTWIEIPIPQLIDDETWERARKLKKQRSSKAKRNTKVVYLLQHLLKCGECGRNFHARASWTTTSVRKGKAYTYDLTTPRRYYMCNGMQSMRLRCREKPYIRAERSAYLRRIDGCPARLRIYTQFWAFENSFPTFYPTWTGRGFAERQGSGSCCREAYES